MVTGICDPNKFQVQHQHNTVALKNLTNLTSLNIIKKILRQHSWKPYSLYKFSKKPVSDWRQIKHWHCTISMPPKTAFSKQLESKCLYIPANLHKKIFVTETYKVCIWWLNDFLKAACCFYLIKCFKFFNWSFWKVFFSISVLSSIALKLFYIFNAIWTSRGRLWQNFLPKNKPCLNWVKPRFLFWNL